MPVPDAINDERYGRDWLAVPCQTNFTLDPTQYREELGFPSGQVTRRMSGIHRLSRFEVSLSETSKTTPTSDTKKTSRYINPPSLTSPSSAGHFVKRNGTDVL